jgi:hypothetical protein
VILRQSADWNLNLQIEKSFRWSIWRPTGIDSRKPESKQVIRKIVFLVECSSANLQIDLQIGGNRCREIFDKTSFLALTSVGDNYPATGYNSSLGSTWFPFRGKNFFVFSAFL